MLSKAATILARLKFKRVRLHQLQFQRQGRHHQQIRAPQEDAAMGDRIKTNDGFAMDGKLTSRSDSYEIKNSQVKQRPPAPAPMVKAQAVAPPPKPEKK
jgi:hypothetical protein